MMAFTCDLGNGQQVYLENQGLQTIITMISSRPGQQQSQRTSFQTGSWSATPRAYQTETGVILQIETTQKRDYITIEGNNISIMNHVSSLGRAREILLQQTEHLSTGVSMQPMQPMEPMKPIEPMKPMEPLKMGNMEMRMNPMEMRMGSMQMSVEQPNQSPKAGQHFCSQCGHSTEPADRFCSNCGHRLQ